MFSGITTICFATSYAVALALECARSVWSAAWRRRMMLGFLAAGFLAHTLYLAARATAANASPLSSPYDWYLLASWTLVVLGFYLEAYYPKSAVALFLLPLVLGLIGAAQFADPQPFAPHRASRGWGNVHGVSLLLGTVSVTIGFMAGLMYLVQSYRLKHRVLPSEGFRLPSLERLDAANSRTIAWSTFFIGIGLGSGIVLNLIKNRSHDGYLPWSDPAVWMVGVMFLWLLVANLFNWIYRPARQGRKVAYLTVASFVCLVITTAILLFGNSRHVSGRTSIETPQGHQEETIEPRAGS